MNIINVDYKKDVNKDLGLIYIGGRGLHDLDLQLEIDLLIEIINEITDKEKKLIIGRLNANENKKLSVFLEKKNIKFDKIEDENKKVCTIKSIFKSIMPDYSEPWIFFETNDIKNQKHIIEKFWYCYGGHWIFLYPSDNFNFRNWELKKKYIEYNVSGILKEESKRFKFSLIINDDYEILIYIKRSFLFSTIKKIKKIIVKKKIDFEFNEIES
jgi:hypothetical protein